MSISIEPVIVLVDKTEHHKDNFNDFNTNEIVVIPRSNIARISKNNDDVLIRVNNPEVYQGSVYVHRSEGNKPREITYHNEYKIRHADDKLINFIIRNIYDESISIKIGVEFVYAKDSKQVDKINVTYELITYTPES